MCPVCIDEQIEAIQEGVEGADRLHHRPRRVERRSPTIAIAEPRLPFGEKSELEFGRVDFVQLPLAHPGDEPIELDRPALDCSSGLPTPSEMS